MNNTLLLLGEPIRRVSLRSKVYGMTVIYFMIFMKFQNKRNNKQFLTKKTLHIRVDDDGNPQMSCQTFRNGVGWVEIWVTLPTPILMLLVYIHMCIHRYVIHVFVYALYIYIYIHRKGPCVREDLRMWYRLRFSTEIYKIKREKTVFRENPQEACFVLTEISENLRKPPGAYGIM